MKELLALRKQNMDLMKELESHRQMKEKLPSEYKEMK